MQLQIPSNKSQKFESCEMSLSVQISHLKDNLQLQIKRFMNTIAVHI